MRFSVYIVGCSVYGLNNLELHKTLAVKNIFMQENQCNPGLCVNQLLNNLTLDKEIELNSKQIILLSRYLHFVG